jgi:hypothetical protein
MVRRTIARQAPGTWMPRVPGPLVRALAWLWRRAGRGGAGPGALARLAQDQDADAGPARVDFRYEPGPFRP